MKKLSSLYLYAYSALAAVIISAGLPQVLHASERGAADIANEIIELRSKRAATLSKGSTEISPKDFKEVCGPVKKRVKEIVKSEGVKVRHAARKNRNPNHAVMANEEALYAMYEKDPSLSEFRDEVTIEGKRFSRYSRPIYVEDACLACHGPEDKRPAFVKKRFPKDRAFGFKAGDLRAIIEIMSPQK